MCTCSGVIRNVAFGHRVDEGAQRAVVVGHVRQSLEPAPPHRDQLVGRVGIEEPPDGRRDAQVVDHRRAAEERRPPQPDRGHAGENIVGVLPLLQVERLAQTAGQREGVSLVGSLVTEQRALRLAAAEVARAVVRPPVGDVVR